MSDTDPSSIDKPPPINGERHTLKADTELRIEVPTNVTATIILLQGSAEIFGAELCCAPANTKSSDDYIKQSYRVSGHSKFAIFTWHGCTIDVEVEFGKSLDIIYTSDETACNIAYVNTHIQLEALRDEALNHNLKLESNNITKNYSGTKDGPRVLIVGPVDSGKTSLARVLSAYAVKLGRSPLLVDLDVSQNMLSVPGTITASPMTPESVSVSTYANSGNTIASGTTPLVLWYGTTNVSTNPDLYKAQLDKLGKSINTRLKGDVDTRSSGIIINAGSWIEDIGYKMLLHSVDTLDVNVILIMGHDRLYSMLRSHYTKQQQNSSGLEMTIPKIIKLPRSGGVVSRDDAFRRISRNSTIKKYFYGDCVRNANATSKTDPSQQMALQYTPTLVQIPFDEIVLYKLSSVSLEASMLPVSAKQTTDPVQLTKVEASLALKHVVLAVCHPSAVESYTLSGKASDLYLSGIAGIVSVEKVDMDKEILSILSPCAGSLPSMTLLLGDITWME